MKIFLGMLLILLTLFIGFQIYTTVSTNKSNAQPYQVEWRMKDFEIRFYPSSTMATITSSAKSYKELGSSGFKKLAGYIFGGNETQQKIAMTSPVHMTINDSASTMSFVMPTQFNKENLPQPNDNSVVIKTTSDEYVAAMTFGGFASDADIKRNTEKFENALKTASITYHGNFRYLGYNPPYQLFGRRNEIIVGVNWVAK